MPKNESRPYLWQQAAWNRCIEAAEQRRLGHATLLTAAPGTGLLHFVRCFCAHLLKFTAAAKLPPDQPHPDLHWLRKEEPGSHNQLTKPRTQILIGQVRVLAGYLSQKPTGPLKVAVIEDVHNCSESATNALLKPLEEPAQNSHILLMSEMPGQILATIRSRCTQIKVGRPDAHEAADWLADFDADAARWALWMTGQAPIIARTLIEDGTIEMLIEFDGRIAEWLTSNNRNWKFLQQFAKQDRLLVNQLLLRAILAAGLGPDDPDAKTMPKVKTVATLSLMSKPDLVLLLDDCMNKRRANHQLPVLNHELLLLNQFQHWLELSLA